MSEEQPIPYIDLDKKIDLLHNAITRTDSYLNSANTKSTIMLTFSMALGTAICINSISILRLGPGYHVAIAIAIMLLLNSSIHSLLSIRPFLTPSEKSNMLSFVDITSVYKTPNEYENKINTINKSDMICEMSSLNYALSKGLMKKYKSQKYAVDSIISSLILMAITLLFAFNQGF